MRQGVWRAPTPETSGVRGEPSSISTFPPLNHQLDALLLSGGPEKQVLFLGPELGQVRGAGHNFATY